MSLLNPENFSTGGFFEDGDVTFTNCRVGLWEHADGKLMFMVDFVIDGEAAPRTEYWGVGDTEKFTASADGSTIVAATPDARIHASSKMGLLMLSLSNAGFPRAKLSNNVTVFNGLRAHVTAVDMPEMKQSADSKFKPKVGADGKVAKPKVVIVTKLLDTPAPAATAAPTQAPAASAGASTAPAATAPSAAAGGDLKAAAAEATVKAVIEVIAEKKGSVKKGDLPAAMFTKLKYNLDYRKIGSGLVGDSAWLGAQSDWLFDPATGVLSIPQ